MAIAALITWIATIGAGWSLLAIWLVEYDEEFHAAAPTRLPRTVLGAHALLAIGGLGLWIGYLLVDTSELAGGATLILVVVAVLGFIMAARWLGVYRAHKTPSAAVTPAGGGSATSSSIAPPERHLPVTLVIGHGVLAVATVILVVLTVFASGS